VEAVTLFLILFLWQVPHFLAIAWIYREDYGRAGMKMLPVVDPAGSITGRQMVLYCICLIAVSLLPVFSGKVGWLYGAGAALAGGTFFYTTVRFVQRPSMPHARQVLRGSLLYLPITLVLLLVCSHL
jgi:protoheme IX farnesyltransferase